MENTYRIFFEGESGYVIVGKKRMSMDEVVDIFRIRMLNTLKAMENGNLSKAITLSVKEIIP